MAGCTRGKIIRFDENLPCNFVVPVHLGMEGGQEMKKSESRKMCYA